MPHSEASSGNSGRQRKCYKKIFKKILKKILKKIKETKRYKKLRKVFGLTVLDERIEVDDVPSFECAAFLEDDVWRRERRIRIAVRLKRIGVV